MSSSRQRVSRRDQNLKRDPQEDEDMALAQDDELERAEALLRQKKKQSPSKKRQEVKQQSSGEDDSEESEDEYDSEEMNDFIANDEEVEAELIEQKRRDRKTFKQQEKREKRSREIEPLCEDDLDVIRENVGIEIKKKQNRLKRMADTTMKEEQIDTSVKRESQQDVEMINTNVVKMVKMKSNYEIERSANVDPDRLRQAQEIFGDDEERKEISKTDNKGLLQDMFNADDNYDPFSTELDKQIAEFDAPERLQVRAKESLPKPSEEELRKESQYVYDRLTCMTGESGRKYGALLNHKDTKDKIFKVLKMFRIDLLDIPMIINYRKYEYATELDEEAVWLISNLDQEYVKFQRHKTQIREFIARVVKFDTRMKVYDEELNYCKNQSELNNFNALIRYLRSLFSDKLLQEESALKRKQPQRRDEVQVCVQNRLHEFAQLCFLSWAQFQENIQLRKLSHKPPEPKAHPQAFAAQFQCDQFPDELSVFQSVCKFAAIELSSQPIIREMMKKQFKEHGNITTEPTEQGKKDLDVFHQSYRVKKIDRLCLKDLINSDLYLDVLQCERSNLITVKFEIDPIKKQDMIEFLEDNYMPDRHIKENWNIMRQEVIKILFSLILEPEIIKELREEIREEAELHVIRKCRRVYKEMLMTGPFQTSTVEGLQMRQPEVKKKGKVEEEIIKDRERLCVMGALMHQIDANNYIVTVAVVDKYGDLVAHKDFIRMLPPRQKRQQENKDAQGNERPLPKTEEEKEHEQDKAKLISIMQQHSVDLIVVAANCLEARKLKQVMEEIALEMKNLQISDDQDKKKSEPQQGKEAFVIWGSTEVAKLFSMSHNSQKLHKGVQQILKQTISLARFEQDPMVEILNLWSPIIAENQALMLQLDPMQKLVNQARLADGLEEVNIQVVNDIGVDFNLTVEHEHMHCVLQFLSGLGPRKSKRIISETKSTGKKLSTRGEMLRQKLLGSCVYMSLVPFIKIRIPPEDFGSTNYTQKFDILDQTRIHHEHYKLAMKIAADAFAEDDQREFDKTEQNRMCKEIISQPGKLENLDLKQYFTQLEMTNMGNMKSIIEQIIKEFQNPFKDPRQARIPGKSHSISNEKLFYLLIDETTRTFKKGLIVTATVTKVFDNKVICRLENGLNAIIPEEAILEDTNQKLKDIVEVGHIVTGRIEKINTDEDKKFEVILHCKKKDLQSHEKYRNVFAESLGIKPSAIPIEDLRNQNFTIDLQPKQVGRFVPRRIAYEKFKNISSRRALAELHDADVGDFVFRPSTRPDENHITLTWKFWKKHFVHIDIAEHDKHPGSAIGSRLVISSDSYENLREIVERYIIPCNRLVRDVTSHPKWSDLEKWEDFEESLKNEKAADKTRIPYRFAIFPQYPQHVVIGYVPREKVVKEFIKIRPKGYYFHEQNLTPFMSLVNWFKEHWSSKDYQRQLKRQKSPRLQVKVIGQKTITPGEEFGNSGRDWQAQGGSSAYGNSEIKQEPRGFGRGQRSARKSSPGGWAEVKNEGNRSPAYPQSPSYNAAPQRGQRRDRGQIECFSCKQQGHIARDCPNQDDRGGFKRQRNNDGGSNRRDEGWTNDKQGENGWDNKQSEAPKQDHAGWVNNQTSTGW